MKNVKFCTGQAHILNEGLMHMLEGKKVVHLANLSDFGGVERIISDLFLHYPLPNHYIINVDSYLSKNLQQFRKYIIFASRLIKCVPVILPVWLRKKWLWMQVNALQPDYIVIWNQVISLKGKRTGSKVIYYDHGAAWELPDNAKTQAFFRQLDGCICVSEASCNMLNHRFHPDCRIQVVRNGITLPQWPVKKLLAKNDRIIAGCAARITPIKAMGLIPLIVEQLIRRDIKIHFIIAGAGEERQQLQRLITDKNLTNYIEFRGFIHDMADFYQHLDIYISTSAHETCSLSCIEAMSFGVPVIAANIDGQSEIIADGVTGFCLTPVMTIDDYCQQTGMASPFDKLVYYPSVMSIASPRLLNPEQVAEKMIEIYQDKTGNYQKNSVIRAQKYFSKAKFHENLMMAMTSF